MSSDLILIVAQGSSLTGNPHDGFSLLDDFGIDEFVVPECSFCTYARMRTCLSPEEATPAWGMFWIAFSVMYRQCLSLTHLVVQTEAADAVRDGQIDSHA